MRRLTRRVVSLLVSRNRLPSHRRSKPMKQHRSIFEWFTVAAAWFGVALAIWTAAYQYKRDRLVPRIEYGQFGAKYSIDGQPTERVYWRLIVSNQGAAPAKDIRIKIWDVPENAKVWCSLASKTEERTSDTMLLRLDVLPPKTNAFVAIHPFDPGAQRLMPYSPDVYNGDHFAKHEQWLSDFAKQQVIEVLAKSTGFKAGVCGSHRTWDTMVTASDIEWGTHFFTVEDR